MHKKKLKISVKSTGLVIVLLLNFLVFLLSSPVLAAWTENDNGIQTFYQDKVPQFTNSGQIQYTYSSNSFFLRGLYSVDIGPVRDAQGHPQAQVWKVFPNVNSTISRNTLPELKTAGFNTAIRLITIGPGIEEDADLLPNEAELDFMDDSGIKAIVSLYEKSIYAINQEKGQTLATLKATVNRLKTHSSIIGYSIFDEVPDRYHSTLPMSDAKWKVVHDTIKSADPKRPVYANQTASALCLPQFYTDVNSFDFYGKTVSGKGVMNLVGLGNATSRQRKCSSEPVLAIIQAYSRPSIGTTAAGDGKLLPTAAELRAQYYTVIAHGATGIGLFRQNSWYNLGLPWDEAKDNGSTGISPQVNPSLWAAADKTNHEIETWKWVFLAKTAKDTYHVAFDRKPGGLTSLLKDPGDGNKYLLAVSEDIPGDRSSSHLVKFSFSDTINITKVTSLFDNKAVSISDNSFTSEYKKGDVSFYKIEYNNTHYNESDLNKDGKVNIYDYNILVAKFTNPYTLSDYNTLVSNFEK